MMSFPIAKQSECHSQSKPPWQRISRIIASTFRLGIAFVRHPRHHLPGLVCGLLGGRYEGLNTGGIMVRRENSGITLVESAMTLVLLATVMLLSAPLYYKVLDNSRVTAQTNRLVATLLYARAQAVVLMQPVSVCSSDDGLRCTETPWERGYVVFVDNGTAGAVDSNDRVLKRQDEQRPTVTITLAGRSHIRFNPTGGLVARWRTDDTEIQDKHLTQVFEWLQRLSPASSAQAATGADYNGADDQPSAVANLSGVFTVCATQVGRLISVSLQGRIATNTAECK